jgi:hypothetical protein
MKKTNHLPAFLILFLALSLFFSNCSPKGKFRMEHNPAAIPADIKKDGHILLVLKQEIGWLSKKQNRGVQKLMQKYYNGAFEMVSVNELKDDAKYTNTEIYRYLINRDEKNKLVVKEKDFSGPRTSTTTREYAELIITDRKTNEVAHLGSRSASYSLGIKGFAMFMKKK